MMKNAERSRCLTGLSGSYPYRSRCVVVAIGRQYGQ